MSDLNALLSAAETATAQEQALAGEPFCFRDYLSVVAKKPTVAALAHARLYDMIKQAGITAGDDITVYAGFGGAAETANEYAYLWGAQLEPNAFVSSYVPTTTATVARVTDLLYFPFTLTPRAKAYSMPAPMTQPDIVFEDDPA